MRKGLQLDEMPSPVDPDSRVPRPCVEYLLLRYQGMGSPLNWQRRNMDVSIENSSDFLTARLTGVFSLVDAERTFLRILGAIAQHDASKVLVDGRAIEGQPRTVERFYYGQFVANAVTEFCSRQKRARPKFSYVLVKPVLDGDRFGNTVAVHRGMNVKTFDNIDTAVKWLTL